MKRMRLHILPTRAVGILTLITIAVMVLSITFILWDLRKRELAHSRLETVSLTEMFMEQTKNTFDNADLVLRGAQERLQNPYGRQFTLDSLPTHLLLGARVSSMRQMTALFIVDVRGIVVNSSQDLSQLISVVDRDYFKAHAFGKSDDLFIGRPVRSRFDGSWTMFLSRQLTGADGKFRGVIVAAVSIQKLEQLYNFMKLDFMRPVSVYLLDGTLVASLPHRENLIGTHAPELGNEPIPAPGENVRLGSHVRGDGGRQGFALGRIAQYPLLVSVTNDEEETLASWRETTIPIVLGAVLLCIFIVITSRVLVGELRREEALSRSLHDANARYHRTVDSVMDAIVAVDEQQNILFFNPAAERMFGHAASTVIGSPLELLIPRPYRGWHHTHIDKYMDSNVSSRKMGPQLDIRGLRADGTEFPIESTISQMVIDGKRQFTAVLRDVTDRRRAEVDMREMNRQLRALSASLQEVREQERTRISRELHDELGQQLTGLKLDLAWLNKRVKEGRELQPDAMDEMRRQLDDAIASVRRISTDLRPPILDDLGFGEAVKWQAAEVAKRSGMDIALKLEAAPLVVDSDLATALFRIVQESLTNSVRHAHASSVEIGLVTDDKGLVLTVRDNGKGFVVEERQGSGIGLASMRERAYALGGRLDISSSPGVGTIIQVKLPLRTLDIAGDLA
jgi:PAS domain S-box-containing protein